MPEQSAGQMFPIMPLVIIVFIWYFLVIRPQMNKQKEHKQLLASVKKNDQVTTAGGIHGTVVNVKEKTVVIRIDDNVKIEVDKEAIATVITDGETKK